jgi:hypothetical protein
MKAHRVDLASLIFGMLFLVGASWWLLAGPLGLGLAALGWAVALVLIMLGVLGLVSAVRGPRGKDAEGPERS